MHGSRYLFKDFSALHSYGANVLKTNDSCAHTFFSKCKIASRDAEYHARKYTHIFRKPRAHSTAGVPVDLVVAKC